MSSWEAFRYLIYTSVLVGAPIGIFLRYLFFK